MKLIKRHLFLTYGLFALLVQSFVYISGAQYDDGGLGRLLIISSPFWGVIYWAPSELLFMLNNGVAIKGHGLISIIIGIGLCLLADFLLNLYNGRSSERLANT